MEAFACLSDAHRVNLLSAESPLPQSVDERLAVEARAEEAWRASPALADYHAECLAAQAERERMVAADQRRQREQAAREAPGHYLAAMRKRGLHFGLSASKNGRRITLPRSEAETLTADERKNLAEFRDGVVAILAAEAEAAAPVEVA
jgi:hypothetical protein